MIFYRNLARPTAWLALIVVLFILGALRTGSWQDALMQNRAALRLERLLLRQAFPTPFPMATRGLAPSSVEQANDLLQNDLLQVEADLRRTRRLSAARVRLLATVLVLRGDYEGAISVVANDPGPIQALTYLVQGQASWALGQTEAALDAWRQAGGDLYYVNLASSLQYRQPELALQYYLLAQAINPALDHKPNPRLAELYALTADHFRLTGRHAEAEEAFRQAIEWEPANPAHHLAAANFYERTDRPAEAIAILREYRILEDPSPDMALVEARLLLQVGDLPAAEALLLEAQPGSDDREIGGIYSLLSQVLVAQGRYAEATEAAQTAIEADPANIDHYIQLARIHESQGDHERAQAVLTEAMAAVIEPAGQARGHTVLGDLYFETGDYESAATAYRQSVSLEPSSPRYRRLAASLEALGDTDGAVTVLNTALKQWPDDPMLHQAWNRLTAPTP